MIIHKAGIVARSWPRKYVILEAPTLQEFIERFFAHLKNCGWRETALDTMESSSQNTWVKDGQPYKQACAFRIERNGNLLKFTVSDAWQTASNVNPFFFTYSPSKQWLLLACEYQFALFSYPSGGDDLFVSSVKLAPFIKNNPWVNAIVATTGEILRTFRASTFDKVNWTLMVPNVGGITQWQGNGNGSPLFFPMRTDDIFSQSGDLKLVHPAFIGWGDSASTAPYLRGFAWNMIFKYGVHDLLSNKRMNNREYIALGNLFNNTLFWEVV